MRSGGLWRGDGGRDAGHLGFKRRARAALHGGRHKAGHDIENGRDGSGGTLRAKHGWKRVGGPAAGAGGDDVADGLMKLVGGALNALEVLAEGASDGLVDSTGRVGVVWHASSNGFSPRNRPFCHFGSQVLGSQPPARTTVPRSTVVGSWDLGLRLRLCILATQRRGYLVFAPWDHVLSAVWPPSSTELSP